MNRNYAIILAGGRGERLWPLSTFARPKQFVTLFGGKPLLAHAVARLKDIVPDTHVFVITSADLVPLTRETLPQLPPENIVGEPVGRDTAAAVALACGLVRARDPEGVAAILTADHLMADEAAFRRVLADACAVAAREPAVVTIGIAPTFPATGYGYIACGEALEAPEATPFRRVLRFVEKPDLPTARAYLETGAYVWNAGMFIWRASVMADAYARCAPDYLPLIERPESMPGLYPTLPKISVDYAIMEKCGNLLVARGDFGWDDVGSLTALAAHFPADARGNALLSPATLLDADGCTVAAQGTDRHTALLGVSGLIVIHTPQATLVCSRDAAQDLKALVARLPQDLR